MTGYRSKHFRWNCHGPEGCYHDQLPDWDDLIECFPRGIRPTDVDGMVEVNGHFLFIEQKGQGASLSTGQASALRQLARLPDFTVMVIRPGVETDLQCLVLGQGDPLGWQPKARQWLMDWIREWAADADSREPSAISELLRSER